MPHAALVNSQPVVMLQALTFDGANSERSYSML